MYALVDMTNAKPFGTFKFQYSKYYQVNKDKFVPMDDKKLAEQILGWFFGESLRRHFARKIISTEVCKYDSNKKADILMNENGVDKGVQITRLQFTRYEERKNISFRMNGYLAEKISGLVPVGFPIVVNIFPTSEKGTIPLRNISRGKQKIYLTLCTYVAKKIIANLSELSRQKRPIWITIDDPKLAAYFKFIVLNPIPKGSFSRFPGNGNICVNYDQDDVAFNSEDIDGSIDELYRKKNSGHSEILLIWAEDFDLATQKKEVAERIWLKFRHTTFSEVFFMTFENHITRFIDTLQLWPIKTIQGIQ